MPGDPFNGRPPCFVDAGPCPGIYASEEAYMSHLKRQGIKHPLGDFQPMPENNWPKMSELPPETTREVDTEIRPIVAEPCSEEEARKKLEEFFVIYERANGSNLRVELVWGVPGIRFALVGDWEE